MKSILLVAAENSAENYAVQVVREFTKKRLPVRFFGIGGDRLGQAGMDIRVHNRTLAIVGIIEILAHLRKINRAMRQLLREARRTNAAAALLIDYPDFNLRLAKKLKKAGIPVYYYISPTVWAWRYSRVRVIRRWVDHLFVIFPFEVPIYQRENIPFTYTGHPLLGQVKPRRGRLEYRRRRGVSRNEKLIALLPGSRPAEVRRLLPAMTAALERLRGEFPVKAFILRARNIEFDTLRFRGRGGSPWTILDQSESYDLLHAADAVITTCGTSNLEAALLGAPFVALYRVNRLSYLLGRGLVRISLYSIVNILAGKEVVRELIQDECRSESIYRQTKKILTDAGYRRTMIGEFARIKEKLSQKLNPSRIIQEKISADLGLRKN